MARKISPFQNKNLLMWAISDSSSKKEVIEKMGLRSAGGNYKSLTDAAEKFGLILPDGNDSKKGRKSNYATPNKEIFVEDSKFSNRHTIKQRMYAMGVPEQCAECGIGNFWNGKKLTLQLEHINGIHNDNRLENLSILCPNCHSQTKTYAGGNHRVKRSSKKHIKNNKTTEKLHNSVVPDITVYICSCGKTKKTKHSKQCPSCAQSRVFYPPVQLVRELVEKLGYSATGRKIGVSDNAIRKFLKRKENIKEERVKEVWTDCLKCEKIFKTKPSRIRKYCSKKCYNDCFSTT